MQKPRVNVNIAPTPRLAEPSRPTSSSFSSLASFSTPSESESDATSAAPDLHTPFQSTTSLPFPSPPPLPRYENGLFYGLDLVPDSAAIRDGRVRRRTSSAPNIRNSGTSSSSAITTRTTTNISIHSPSSTELTSRLSKISCRVPRPMPIHIQSIQIDLGGGQVFDNLEAAIEAVRIDERNWADVTIIAIGEGPWGSEIGRWVQEGSPERNIRPLHDTLPQNSSEEFTHERHPPITPPLPPQTSLQSFCLVCDNTVDEKKLFRASSPRCHHEPQICHDCFESWMKSMISQGQVNSIPCPDSSCGEELEQRDVERALDSETGRETREKYIKLRLRGYLSSLPNFTWCLRPGCDSGQIHDGETGPIMTCVSCGFKTCAEHQVPWHEGMSCHGYDLRFSRTRTEEILYKILVKFISMKDCPNCGVAIQKSDGCDHMRCSACKAEFCYRCQRDYEGMRGIWARGKNAHHITCRHYWARMPWNWFRDD